MATTAHDLDSRPSASADVVAPLDLTLPPPSFRAQLEVRGPFSLAEVATMGFGHRDEPTFDGVMRLAFCVDGDYERQVGVEVRQGGQQLELQVVGLPGSADVEGAAEDRIKAQVARVLSVDHDGDAFAALCRADPALAAVHAAAPGFRPALFYSPYEAAVWSVISARRARSQGISLRTRIGQQHGAVFELAGVPTVSLPTPSQLLALEAVPGLPADRVPRLHAIARAAQEGLLSASRLLALDPAVAQQELQQLPGIGPFYSSLILIRACGATDLLPADEAKGREAIRRLYGWEQDLSDSDYEAFAERWRPWRTWVAVLARAMSGRLPST